MYMNEYRQIDNDFTSLNYIQQKERDAKTNPRNKKPLDKKRKRKFL